MVEMVDLTALKETGLVSPKGKWVMATAKDLHILVHKLCKYRLPWSTTCKGLFERVKVAYRKHTERLKINEQTSQVAFNLSLIRRAPGRHFFFFSTHINRLENEGVTQSANPAGLHSFNTALLHICTLVHHSSPSNYPTYLNNKKCFRQMHIGHSKALPQLEIVGFILECHH